LVGRAQSGDVEAFCELAKSYQRRIYLLALHYCRNPHDAEDLSQEVWLRAFRSLGKFRGEASFYTWLRQITINAFLNHRRELTVMSGDEKINIDLRDLETLDETTLHASASGIDAEDRLEQKILVERVMRALGELTPHSRLMFLLKHREGMTYEEISRAFGCSTGTVKKSLFRAVSKLRQHLGIGVGASDSVAPYAASEKG
jgi:RNA polymerase sigma-70 factor (ECF subfamily)